MTKFLIDAQLPYLLKDWLVTRGYDAIHTKDLPKKNVTGDTEVIRIAESEQRIIISKDSDFIKLNILSGKPSRILAITTGNIVNKELLRIFESNMNTIVKLFETSNVVEIDNSSLKGH